MRAAVALVVMSAQRAHQTKNQNGCLHKLGGQMQTLPICNIKEVCQAKDLHQGINIALVGNGIHQTIAEIVFGTKTAW